MKPALFLMNAQKVPRDLQITLLKELLGTMGIHELGYGINIGNCMRAQQVLWGLWIIKIPQGTVDSHLWTGRFWY